MTARDVRLLRDCYALSVSDGTPVLLEAQSPVRVMQKRGDAFVLLTSAGEMVRLPDIDADALGGEDECPTDSSPPAPRAPRETTIDDVYRELHSVYDPEIPVDIVELGLVYACELDDLPSGGLRAAVRMTLTAPGCAMSDVIKRDVESRLSALPGVEDVEVAVVFDPPWNRSMMSEAARLELGFF